MKTQTLALLAASALAAMLAPAPLPTGQTADAAAQSAPASDAASDAVVTPETEAPKTIAEPRYYPIAAPESWIDNNAGDACDCDCLTEAEVREIVRDEIAKFQSTFKVQTNATHSAGSTGGQLSAASSGGSLAATSTIWRSSGPVAVQYRTTPTNAPRRPTITRSQSNTVCAGGVCTTQQTTTTRPRVFGRLFGR